jgi:lysophospholipase L1-like esterase
VLRRLLASAAVAAAALAPGGSAQGGELPRRRDEILFVGDSVTAGVYFMALSNESARAGWAAQVLARLGLPEDPPRLPGPYPVGFRTLAFRGIGLAGLSFVRSALPSLFRRGPLFERGEPRTILAVPGQTLREVLEQSSARKVEGSSGWVLAARLLPRGLTTIETAETSARSPRWVFLFIGANDLLASFGIVGRAAPPAPAAFAADYERLAARLRALMPEGTPAAQFLVATLPDVTELPFLQPTPPGARDGGGEPLPPGTRTSAFLLPFRTDRFEEDEVWTPDELDRIREVGRACNEAIRAIAAREGFGVLDIAGLLDALRHDPAFASSDSPYFGPDLHHPSARTHGLIADLAITEMCRAAAADPGAFAPPATDVGAGHPHNGQLRPDQRERVDTMMRVALLGMSGGDFPPRPTGRLALEIAAHAGAARTGDVTLAALAGLEGSPTPITTRWLSRGFLQGRLAAAWREGDDPRLPRDGVELRAGTGVEPVGRWRWTRLELGLRYERAHALGWFARGEWRVFFAEASSGRLRPDQALLGLRVGAVPGRPGHNGN